MNRAYIWTGSKLAEAICCADHRDLGVDFLNNLDTWLARLNAGKTASAADLNPSLCKHGGLVSACFVAGHPCLADCQEFGLGPQDSKQRGDLCSFEHQNT